MIPYWCYTGEVIEKAGKAFTDTGKVGKKFNPDHPEGTLGEKQTSAPLPHSSTSTTHIS